MKSGDSDLTSHEKQQGIYTVFRAVAITTEFDDHTPAI
jgi:hypothetical protein